ncbi:ABC transporter substrate-binding protein [Nonomuraea lactucae]|uniref:ABC transporter substrate-binding protein n=1 Tax=Nonomuraea lactucae TaxID=2249762 RepID=UPI0013B45EED|nr:ABC transporter substrate-binding protein [Nonomuraea lactucae]
MKLGPNIRASLPVILVAVSLAACTGTGSGVAGGPVPAGAGGRLEKTTLNVGITPTPSSAPLFIAIRRGFFREEGLTVTTELMQAPQSVMPKIKNGSMDVFKGSYVSLINIQDSGAERVKIIADTLQGAPGIAGVVVAKNSPLQSPKDLKDRTIAVNSLHNLGTLSMSAHLRIHGLTPRDVRFVAIDFQAQFAALTVGQVDAAWMVEPFLSAAQQAGARLLIDTNTGPTDALPIDGWATTEDWVRRHPATTAAFQRAVARAQRVIATDRAALAEVVHLYTQTRRQTVMTMAMGTFPTSLNATRIQRVADLMNEFGYLKTEVDVGSMVFTGSGQ